MMGKTSPSNRVEPYLIICREHDIVEAGLDGRYAADTRIDEHRDVEGCDERVIRMTHDQWEQLKKAGALDGELVEGSNFALEGP